MNDFSNATGEILCLGEVLWDALPEGLFLGGAPFNVACHLHALGEEVALVSRVGDDRLGREVRRRLGGRGMPAGLVQTDATRETGFVEVTLDDDGDARYTIVEPVAWDALTLTDALTRRAEEAGVLVFGSLAQRARASRQTIQALCQSSGALKVFDVNLRPPHVHREALAASLEAADVVKLNAGELARLFAEPALWEGRAPGEAGRPLPEAELERVAGRVAERFGCRLLCVTRGAGGSGLWHGGQWWEHPGYPVTVKDTVGAGDAFLAALLSGLLAGQGGNALLGHANRLGAYVAARSGPTPAYDVSGVAGVQDLPLSDGQAPHQSPVAEKT